jgi:hypothetical protein
MIVSFDSVTLTTATYLPRFVKHESTSDRQLSSLSLAGNDGEVLVLDRRGRKTVQMRGTLIGTSQSDLESKIDAFVELFSRPEKNLDIDWNGGTRRYVATCVRHEFDRDHFHISVVPWTAEFVVLSGEGKDSSDTNALTNQLVTITTPGTTSFTIVGSKGAQPVITIDGSDDLPNSVQFPSTAKGLEFKNTDTGEKIVVNVDGTWNGATKKIIIDCLNKEVRQTITTGSEVVVPFYGTFPRFRVGTNNVQITVGAIDALGSTETSSTAPGSALAIDDTSDRLAQSLIVPYTDATFSKVRLSIAKTGSPGTLTVRVETDNGGQPSGTLVTANATAAIVAGDVTGSGIGNEAYVIKAFTGSFALSANTRYWLVLSGASVDGSNKYFFQTSDPAFYANGAGKSSTNGGSTWSNRSGHIFRLYYGGLPGTGIVKLSVAYKKTYL